ncbi:Short-chain dehydrogenase/reductase family 9C member 7 [Aphelenchoides besseyi]|nr:Short-chain dehydrogenase/reductase family 9C member 7 [Aphelenchoides besseyi]KAI6199513.1 Short-chain dehydrogenase/reductase family 9C member 7 [Aphelenchoides besseyi]
MKLKMVTVSALTADHSWITISIVGISVYWILRKLAANLKVFGLHHKAVFLTSCDGGYGREIALRCVSSGIPVYAGCVRTESCRSLEEAARYAKGRLVAVQFDITSTESVESAVEFVRNDLPPKTKLWALLNTNEQPHVESPEDRQSNDEFKLLMELNYCGGVRCTHAFLPLIKSSRGRIGIIQQISGNLLMPWGSTFAGAHKMALGTYIEFIASELQHYKIKFAIFEPGVSTSALLCQEAIRERADFAWNKMSPNLRRELGEEYKVKLLKHWSSVIDMHSNADTRNVVNAALHFVTSRFPRTNYKCGPSVILRTIYLMLLNFVNTVKSSCTSTLKAKEL